MPESIDGLTEEQLKQAREGYVPLDRLNEATGKLKDENSRLRESFSSLEAQVQALQEGTQPQAQPQQQQQREYSRAELRQYVESGQITQQEADEVWDRQQEAKFDRKLHKQREELQQELVANDSMGTLRSTIKQYIDAVPEVAEKGSEVHGQLLKEFNRLTRITGVPKPNSKQALELEVIALENVYGSPENAKKLQKQRDKQPDQDLMEDTPSREEATPVPETKVLKGLTPKQKTYYQRAIDRGVYKDWKAVEAELTWRDKQR